MLETKQCSIEKFEEEVSSFSIGFRCPFEVGKVVIDGEDTSMRTHESEELKDGSSDTSISHDGISSSDGGPFRIKRT